MLCINGLHTDPFFNLASEEYILKNYRDDCFLLYRNEPSVIVGKHQNPLAEINMGFIRQKNIIIARRVSGGGTVYHDQGNLNYTFIVNGNEGNLVNFRKFTTPVIEVLQDMGLDAKFEGRNDITLNGKKISGNAEHIWKNRTLHHGTLLFSSNLKDLSEALKPGQGKFLSKATKSIRSRVTNISEHLSENMDMIKFGNRIMEYIMKTNPNSRVYEFTAADLKEIERLKNEKYMLWDWNFGYSPAYSFENTYQSTHGKLILFIKVEKGYIQNFRISGDPAFREEFKTIEKSLTGVRHEKEMLKEKLSSLNAGIFIEEISLEDFLNSLF